MRFDTDLNSGGEEQKLVFRILYWASYLGRIDIVDYIVKKGYSPFVKSFHSQTALMAAVQYGEHGQVEIVKLFLGYKYKSSNMDKFRHSKLHSDSNGNTALHLAYKMVKVDIA